MLEKSSILSSSGNTLYVGGNGPGNYSKINDAYNDANPGDTIFVYSGTYNEQITITKTIKLIGEDKDTTTLIYNHAHWEVIRIIAPGVTVNGFTIYNPNPDLVLYVNLFKGANHTTISNCIFYNNPLHFDDGTVGIGVCDVSYTRISNCTFLYNDDEGICLKGESCYTTVENCVFSNCCDGIEFLNTNFNTIVNCIMQDCTHSGISFTPGDQTCKNNVISNCEIYDSGNFGIFINNAWNNMIYNCTLEDNMGYGIYIHGVKSYNNLIINNKISCRSDPYGEGILLGWSCHNNTFTNNIISENKYGVYIEDTFNQGDCNDHLD